MGRRRSKWKDSSSGQDRGRRLLALTKAGDLAALSALLQEPPAPSPAELRELLQRSQDHNGSTALHLAAAEGHAPVVAELLRLGAGEPHLAGGRRRYARTPLHEAAIHGRLDVCRLLVAAGLLVDCHTTRGRTPLMYAVSGGFEDVARFLAVDCGANADEQNEMGVTPLYLAAQDGNEDMVRLLVLETRADVNRSNRTRHSPLHEAVAGGFASVAAFLMDHGADRHAVDAMGVTVWHEAAGNGAVELLELLVKYDVSLHPAGRELVDKVMARHPFHYAAVEGKAEFVRAMLERRLVDVDLVDADSCTALYYAAANGHARVLETLLEFGADPNLASLRRSPLHCAVEWHRVDCVEILVRHGAAVGARDKDGLTPVDSARGKGFEDLVALLEQAP